MSTLTPLYAITNLIICLHIELAEYERSSE